MDTYPLLIAGDERTSARVDEIRSPYDGTLVGLACAAGPGDLEDALGAAHAARSMMRDLPTHARAALLTTIAGRLRAEAEPLARLIALECGKPLRFARAEVVRGALTFELAAGEARSFGGEVLPVDLEPRGEGRLCIAQRVPRGVVAAIAPFNFPLNLVAHKVAPALAVGAPCVLKPAPQCPLTAMSLARFMVEAGVPRGALSALHCAPEVAERLAHDARVAVLSFTGSDAVGWRLKSLAAKQHVLLELGGNAPCIVDETVDLEATIEPLALAAFAFAGQTCIKAQRIYVHRSRFAEFSARFVAAANALVCGDPLDERTVVGPLIEERHVVRVLAWIDEARALGARVLCGATRQGRVLRPTVVTGAPDEARVCSAEIFGPVAVLEPFDEFGAVLARCNATRFGLQAGLFTRDLARVLRAARELDYGGVIVNDAPTFRIDNFPYGGTKDSGIGREGVRSAMQEFTESRVLILRAPLER